MNSSIDISTALTELERQLARHIERIQRPVTLVGIHAGGVWVAQRLAQSLKLDVAPSTLDISFYRDDYDRRGLHPDAQPTSLPSSIDGHHIVLIDDVLFTGRTVRAALNVLFDYGRPAQVSLAVLFDRGGRELPVQADLVGMKLDLPVDQFLRLRDPDLTEFDLVNAP